MQLRQKGVATDIIADVVSQLDGDEQLQRLVDKLQRKRSITKAATTYELRGKLLRYALGLGYDYDLAIAAVDSVTE
jgi:regulatory protein